MRIINQSYDVILKSDVIPLAIGGDHSITLPMLRSIAKTHGPVALVHVDAHADENDEMFGETETHGTVFRRAYEEGTYHSFKNFPNWLAWNRIYSARFHRSYRLGVSTVFSLCFWGVNLTSIGQEIRRKIAQSPVYITFDIESLDLSYAPCIGTPEIGGLTTPQAIQLLRALNCLNIVGCDLVEVSPHLRHIWKYGAVWREYTIRNTMYFT